MAQTNPENPVPYPMDAKDGNVDKESCLNTPQPLGISGHRLARSPGSFRYNVNYGTPKLSWTPNAKNATAKGHRCYIIIALLKLERYRWLDVRARLLHTLVFVYLNILSCQVAFRKHPSRWFEKVSGNTDYTEPETILEASSCVAGGRPFHGGMRHTA